MGAPNEAGAGNFVCPGEREGGTKVETNRPTRDKQTSAPGKRARRSTGERRLRLRQVCPGCCWLRRLIIARLQLQTLPLRTLLILFLFLSSSSNYAAAAPHAPNLWGGEYVIRSSSDYAAAAPHAPASPLYYVDMFSFCLLLTHS